MTENGLIPQAASGSETTYYCDGLWFNKSCYALFGGSCDYGLKVGAFYLNLNNAVSNSNWNIGAALSYLSITARRAPTPQALEIELPAVEIKP